MKGLRSSAKGHHQALLTLKVRVGPELPTSVIYIPAMTFIEGHLRISIPQVTSEKGNSPSVTYPSNISLDWNHPKNLLGNLKVFTRIINAQGALLDHFDDHLRNSIQFR